MGTELLLRWKDHHGVLFNAFGNFLSRKSLVDCTVAADGRFLSAHKVVLSACSPYFERLLSHVCDKHPIIFLKDVNFEELTSLINFIYSGQIKIPENSLIKFLNLAKSLEIKGLGGFEKKEQREEKCSRQKANNVQDSQKPTRHLSSSSENNTKDSSPLEPIMKESTRPCLGSNVISAWAVSVDTVPPRIPLICKPSGDGIPAVEELSVENVAIKKEVPSPSANMNQQSVVAQLHSENMSNKGDERMRMIDRETLDDSCAEDTTLVLPEDATLQCFYEESSGLIAECDPEDCQMSSEDNIEEPTAGPVNLTNPTDPKSKNINPVVAIEPLVSTLFTPCIRKKEWSNNKEQIDHRQVISPVNLTNPTDPKLKNIHPVVLIEPLAYSLISPHQKTKECKNLKEKSNHKQVKNYKNPLTSPVKSYHSSAELSGKSCKTKEVAKVESQLTVTINSNLLPTNCPNPVKKHKKLNPKTAGSESARHSKGQQPQGKNAPRDKKSNNSKKQNIQGKKVHKIKKKFMCSVCYKKFCKKSILANHMRLHSVERKNACSLCSIRFTKKYQLRIHMLSHSRVRAFSCDLCGKSYFHKRNLMEHNDIVHRQIKRKR